jgi:hypothetical protein
LVRFGLPPSRKNHAIGEIGVIITCPTAFPHNHLAFKNFYHTNSETNYSIFQET